MLFTAFKKGIERYFRSRGCVALGVQYWPFRVIEPGPPNDHVFLYATQCFKTKKLMIPF